ncbi:AbrB family transcriptional regulator [Peribacillus cavernae]|uniref:AbrB family transcriptional regulator n=1 Tax=Peribacillus cavernae TaxID=1674310 RepID=UPI00163C63C5|nr:AbrB family transcriptional regulator [Peribacillus cavernae]MDQ0220363.1 membrane AbrB-like protein [Peribacillus cavernae]
MLGNFLASFLQNKQSHILFVVPFALLGGFLFQNLGLFLPWLLGPLFIVMAARIKFEKYMHWPGVLRSLGLIILGLQLGSSFTREALGQMGKYLPLMLVTTVLIILFTIFTAYLLAKRMNISLNTALLGSFPGGLSQMVVLSGEIEDADETVVAFMQTLRIILVISIVPWLVIHILSERASLGITNAGKQTFFLLEYDWKLALLIILVTAIFITVGKKASVPIPFMLGPLLAAALFNVAGSEAPQIPTFWLNFAQLLLGAHLGYTLKVNNPRLFRRMFGMIFVTNVLLIGFCYALTIILVRYFQFPINELFLSIAPGGVTEMAVTAMAVHADVSLVTSFHLFRILFILFLLSPVMKWMAGKWTAVQKE